MNRKKIVFVSIVLIPIIIAFFCKIESCQKHEEDFGCKSNAAPTITTLHMEQNQVESVSDSVDDFESEFSEEEINLIRRTVYCESGNQDYKTQVMVAKTIINRVRSELFPNTAREVIYQPNQYEVTEWNNFEDYYWTEQVEEAVDEAIMTTEYPEDMFYFRNDYYHNFGYPYTNNGVLYFSTQEAD